MLNTNNNQDRAAQRDHERDARANSDDGYTRGYNWRPDYFRTRRALTYRLYAARADWYLFEDGTQRKGRRWKSENLRRFIRWQAYRNERFAQINAMFKAIDARRAAEAAAKEAQKGQVAA